MERRNQHRFKTGHHRWGASRKTKYQDKLVNRVLRRAGAPLTICWTPRRESVWLYKLGVRGRTTYMETPKEEEKFWRQLNCPIFSENFLSLQKLTVGMPHLRVDVVGIETFADSFVENMLKFQWMRKMFLRCNMRFFMSQFKCLNFIKYKRAI